MGNKPFKLRLKGEPLKVREPTQEIIPKESPPKKGKRRLFAPWRGRSAAAQLGLVVVLAALCGVYVASLNQDATTVLAVKRELPVYSVERSDSVVAISFDASWGGDKTIAILDILDKYKVKTTFFLVGMWVDKYPELVKEIAARGHEIGNHSDTHAHMSQQNETQIKAELDGMSDKVEKLTGTRPNLFRPPYGDYDDLVVTTSRKHGYEVVQWSIDSLDWKDRGTQDVIKQCTHRVDKGDIVLFHNDSKDIVNALPSIIEHYQGLGYEIIPVSKILLSGETTIDVQGKQHPAAS